MASPGKHRFDPTNPLAQATNAPPSTASTPYASAFHEAPLPTTSTAHPALESAVPASVSTASASSGAIAGCDDVTPVRTKENSSAKAESLTQLESVEADASSTSPCQSLSDDANELSGGPVEPSANPAEMVERNYAIVYRYAYRLTGCAATAEDITQEAFLQAIAHQGQLRAQEAERSWLLAIARRQFMRWLRKVANPTHGRPVSLDSDAALGQEVVANDNENKRLDDQDWIQSALAEIGYDARIALLMYYFEDLSYTEIAAQLQIPIGTVMSRLSRGRQQLRSALEHSDNAEDSRSSQRGDSLQRFGNASSAAAPPPAHNLAIPAHEVKHG